MGISHIEFWVSDMERSLAFYSPLFSRLGWRQIHDHEFTDGTVKIYFIEKYVAVQDAAGPRHLCFKAESRARVDEVAAFLRSVGAMILRGPCEMKYSEGYYTVDFKDPDGYILEVAHAPNSRR
jgi:catechol 2,3-dioxygenase-like lactoylglutathione lyase family enzyme